MLSKFFYKKIDELSFKESINSLLTELNDKKVIIYGAGEGFVELNKQYNFSEKLNVVAIADKKFETDNTDDFLEYKAIRPSDIANMEYDMILVSNEKPKKILEYLEYILCIDNQNIKLIFNEKIKDEAVNYTYLENLNFKKNLEKLTKKLKNKKVVIYGAGSFFELIKEYYDISGLNIIGISDKRFENHEENEEFLGYKTYSPEEIIELKPDYVLVATKFYINIIEDLFYNLLDNTKIKIKPLVKKPLITLIKEIWN